MGGLAAVASWVKKQAREEVAIFRQWRLRVLKILILFSNFSEMGGFWFLNFACIDKNFPKKDFPTILRQPKIREGSCPFSIPLVCGVCRSGISPLDEYQSSHSGRSNQRNYSCSSCGQRLFVKSTVSAASSTAAESQGRCRRRRAGAGLNRVLTSVGIRFSGGVSGRLLCG